MYLTLDLQKLIAFFWTDVRQAVTYKGDILTDLSYTLWMFLEALTIFSYFGYFGERAQEWGAEVRWDVSVQFLFSGKMPTLHRWHWWTTKDEN